MAGVSYLRPELSFGVEPARLRQGPRLSEQRFTNLHQLP